MESESPCFCETDNRVLRFPPAAVTTSVSEVARYAGGSRYRPDEKTVNVIADVLSLSSRLIQPGAVYRLHRLTALDEEGRVKLPGSLGIHLAAGIGGSEKTLLGAVVITLGGALEEEVNVLQNAGEIVRALYLDAAGSALLKGLDNLVEAELVKMAERAGLHPGCRLGPGLNHTPLELQRDLFQLVDPGSLGVTLNDHLVITPAKSVSFFVFFSDSSDQKEKHDCSSCGRGDCMYRK